MALPKDSGIREANGHGVKMKLDQYLHYVPEFDLLVVMEKQYKSFYRDAFLPANTPKRLAKGRTKHVFIARGDFGFRTYNY